MKDHDNEEGEEKCGNIALVIFGIGVVIFFLMHFFYDAIMGFFGVETAPEVKAFSNTTNLYQTELTPSNSADAYQVNFIRRFFDI